MARHSSFITGLLLAALALPPAAIAQPSGPEFPINTYTTGGQRVASVAADAAGGFVVVWKSDEQDGSGTGIFGRRFSSSGSPLGDEFPVNVATAGNQDEPSVAANAEGAFFVVWTDEAGTIEGRRFSSTGAPLTQDFHVSTGTPTPQYSPDVGVDASGGFVVVWTGYIDVSSEIFGRRYASTGEPLGLQFRVDADSADASYPAVAMDPEGGFVVVWESSLFPAPTRVLGQRFASSGDPIGAAFRVSSYTTGGQADPAAVFDTAGRLVVVWKTGQEPSADRIFGRRFSRSGAALGGEFAVSSPVADDQYLAAIASDGGGGFVVSWNGNDGNNAGVLARAFRGSGAPAGPEFRVNTFTTSFQLQPSIASDAKGNFVVVWWTSTLQDGSSAGIFGQRFHTARLSGDVDANGAVDVGDVFYLIYALFAGGPAPMGWGDVNGDGAVNVTDVFYFINFIFAGGPPPL